MVEANQDGQIPAKTRNAGITLIVLAIGAWLLIPVLLLRPNPDANTPMEVGYLCAAGMAMSALGGQALTRRTRGRWWWGVLAILASVVFFATWAYVLLHTAELAPLNRGRNGSAPWVAGPLFGTMAGLLGMGLVRSPQRRKLTPEQRADIEEKLRQFRRTRAANFGVSMVAGVAITLVVVAYTVRDEKVVLFSAIGLALLATVVGYVLWGQRRAVRARRWLLAGSGLVILALLGWGLWRSDLIIQSTSGFVVVGAIATYAVVAIVLGLLKAGPPEDAAVSTPSVDAPTSDRWLN